MTLQPEQEDRIRRYLLGDATPDEIRQVETDLLRGDESVERLLLIEDELIADYARDALTEREMEAMAKNFFITPGRRERLMIAQEMVREAYAYDEVETSSVAQAAEKMNAARARGNMGREWWRALIVPKWKFIASTAFLIAVGLGIWRWPHGESEVEKSLVALNRAYRAQRPLEARITGLTYAPFPVVLGTEQDKIDSRARNLAESTLLEATEQDASPAELHALGRVYLAKKEFAEAKKEFEAALATDPNNAQLHSDLGVALFELGKLEQSRGQIAESEKTFAASMNHFSQALRLVDSLLEARFNRALLFQSLRMNNMAQEDWRRYLEQDPASPWAQEAKQKLKVLEDDGRKRAQTKERTRLDFLRLLSTNDEQGALLAVNRSYSALNEPLNGNHIIGGLIDEFIDAKLRGRNAEAEARWQVIARLGRLQAERAGDILVMDLARYYRTITPSQLHLVRQARQLAKEAYGHYRKSTNDQAVALFEQAKALFAQAGDAPEELYADTWIGHCHHQRSNTLQNLKVFTELVPVLREKRYRWMEATAWCGLANSHNSSGQFSRAIEDAVRCSRIAEEIGDQTGYLRGLYFLGHFYYDLGQHDDNLRLVRKGVELSHRIGAEINYAIAFYYLAGSSLCALGYFDPALTYHQEYLRMAEQWNSPRLTARGHIHIGLTYGKWKWFEQAIASAQRGIEIGRTLATDETGREFVHYGLMHLGHLYREAGRFAEALGTFDQVLEYARRSGVQQYYYSASKGRLLTFIAQDDKAAAQTELDKVLALYEENRKSIREENYRNTFFDQEQGIYDVAVAFAHDELSDPERAFNYAERSRARSLLDAGRQEHELVESRGIPVLRFSDSEPPRELAEIRRRMPEQAQLLVYAVLRDRVIIWVIGQARYKSHPVNISNEELNARIERHLAFISRIPSQAEDGWQATASALHEVLIAPVVPLLDKQKRLCVIADKQLHRLPFGTLFSPASKKTLVEEYVLSYTASASVFLRSTELARRKGGVVNERLLCAGNPDFDKRAFPELYDLPSAEREARKVASYYDPATATVLVGPQVKKSAVLRGLGRADVVHLAMHYLHDQRSPMFSCLPLAAESLERRSKRDLATEKDALHLFEFYKLKDLPARLAILSACRTHAEEYYAGEGAIGIPRPLEAAGIPLVIASLWPAYALATSDLMIAFHRARRGEGRSTAEALREAQLELLHSAGSYRHPYYWSAFIVVGGYSEY